MKAFFRRLWHNFKYNWTTLITFELLYKLFTMGVISPSIRRAFQGILKLSGYSYVTGDNLGAIATNPLAAALTVALLIGMAVYSMIDVSAAIFIFDRSEQEKKTTLGQTLRFSLKNAVRIFSRHNMLIALVMLFMIPFLNIGIGLSFIGTLRLPDFWIRYIKRHTWVGILVVLGILLMIYFVLHWIYSFSYFTLEQKRFRLARRFSRILARDSEWMGITALLLLQGLFWLMYQGISYIGVLIIVLIEKAVEHVSIPGAVFYAVITIFLCSVALLIAAFVVPLSFLVITTLFYHLKEKKGFPVIHVRAPEPYIRTLSHRFKRRLIGVLTAVSVLLSSFYIYGLSTGQYSLNVEGNGNTEVTAHRGASQYYPENTMAAFRGAFMQGADEIELDVHETKDGKLVVLHDSNVKRVAGVDRDIWDMTYREVKELDVGAGFSDKYAGERIPLLSDVTRYARLSGIRLNIELKPTGHGDGDMPKKVVSTIKEYGLEKSVVVSSMSYWALAKVKDEDEGIKTAYITSIAYGDLSKFPDADAFSIEASSVTLPLVHYVHRGGGEIYAWTVNDEARAEDMIADGVDSIITDDVPKVKGYIYDARSSALYGQFVRTLLGRQ